MHGACTAGSGGVNVGGGWTLYCRDSKLLLPLPEEAHRAAGTNRRLCTVISGCSIVLIGIELSAISLQSMKSLTSPRRVAGSRHCGYCRGVTFAVTVELSSFDNAMFRHPGLPRSSPDGDAARTRHSIDLLWALTVAVLKVTIGNVVVVERDTAAR